jgi:hypothetical protein
MGHEHSVAGDADSTASFKVLWVWDTNVGDWPVTQPGHDGLSVVACSDARSGRARLDARLLPDLLPRAEITESA